MAPTRVRVTFARNGGCVATGCVLVKSCSFEALRNAAANKLKISKKQAKSIRLFVRKAPKGSAVLEGTEVPSNDDEFVPNVVENDTQLAVSLGEGFVHISGAKINPSELAEKQVHVPDFPLIIRQAKSQRTGTGARIFCDLDGVLANFASGVHMLTGKTADELGKNKLWNVILSAPDFFTNLPWMPEGEVLWEGLTALSRAYNARVEILTGCPKIGFHTVAEQKRIWCQRHLGDNIVVHTVMSRAKAQFSQPNAILIDDQDRHAKPWTVRNGSFVLYTEDYQTSLAEVESVLKAAFEEKTIDERTTGTISLVGDFSKSHVQSDRNQFISLDGPVLPKIRAALQDCPGFFEKKVDEHYIAFDYDQRKVEWPIVNQRGDQETTLLQYECRGLLVCARTGHILSRRFHKFFNINEHESSLAEDLHNVEGELWEKLDGSLVTPVPDCAVTPSQIVCWAGRTTPNADATDFAKRHPGYDAFALECARQGLTPLFEFLSCEAPVGALSYPADDLVLLGARWNISGEYVNSQELFRKAERFSLRTVGFHGVIRAGEFGSHVQRIRNLRGIEGCVLVLANGQRFKLKTEEYLEISRSMLSRGHTSRAPSECVRDVCLLALDEEVGAIDDAVGLAISKLQNEDDQRHALTQVRKLRCGLDELHKLLMGWAHACHQAADDQGLSWEAMQYCASEKAKKQGFPASVIRVYLPIKYSGSFDDVDCLHQLREFIRHALKSRKFSLVHALTNVNLWESFAAHDNADTVLEQHLLGAVDLAHHYVVVILRGLPGSGKTTLAQRLGRIGEHHGYRLAICSADNFRRSESSVDYLDVNQDSEDVQQAHTACRREFQEFLLQGAGRTCTTGVTSANESRGDETVAAEPFSHDRRLAIIDNTHIRLSQYAWYLKEAFRHGANVLIWSLPPHAVSLKALHQRGLHNVPRLHLHKMLVAWEHDRRAYTWLRADEPDHQATSSQRPLCFE